MTRAGVAPLLLLALGLAVSLFCLVTAAIGMTRRPPQTGAGVDAGLLAFRLDAPPAN